MKANENNDKAIYIDIQKEMSEKIKKIELNEQVFKNKLIILQKKLLQIAKLKCNDTYMWFEKLGEPYVDEKGALQLKFGKNIEENKSYYKELEKCVSKYDYGVQFEMQIQKRKNKEISESAKKNQGNDPRPGPATPKPRKSRKSKKTQGKTKEMIRNL